jgi:hypothetical protein
MNITRYCIAFASCLLVSSLCYAFPTVLHYQGRLLDGTNLVNDEVSAVFRLYSDGTGSDLVYEDSNTVTVVDGLYTAVIGDDGDGMVAALTNERVYLSVEINGTVLSPLEQLGAVSYALKAATVTNGAINTLQLADDAVVASKLADDSVSSNAIMMGSITADKLAGSSVTSSKIENGTITADDVEANTFWSTEGNSGLSGTEFIGSSDSERFEIRCKHLPVFQSEILFDHGGTRLILGTSNTIAYAPGAVISGGFENEIEGNNYHTTIGGGHYNTIKHGAQNSVIGGGYGNRIETNAGSCVIAGGGQNRLAADSKSSVIGGGYYNRLSGTNSVLCGGTYNQVGHNGWSIIGGGSYNIVSGTYASVLGGTGNRADTYGFVGGGFVNEIKNGAIHCVISGGRENEIDAGQNYNTVGGGYRNYITASFNTIGGGQSNRLFAPYSVIGGGFKNFCQGQYGTVAGGGENTADNMYGTIGGGWDNFAGGGATVAGGVSNRASGFYSMVPGGKANKASGNYSFAGGYRAKATNDGSFVWADSTDEDFNSLKSDQFLVRASNGVMMVGSTDLGTLTISPSADLNRDSLIYMTEGKTENYGMLLKYDGGSNHLEILGKNMDTTNGPHLVILRDSSRVGIGRFPYSQALEVEGSASKTVAGEWLANSDAAIKTDIRTITNALETLANLRPVRFRYNEAFKTKHPTIVDRDYCNYIAQEFQEVFPECVETDGEGLLMIDTYNTQPYLVRAVQELSDKLESLEDENESLRQRVTELEAR